MSRHARQEAETVALAQQSQLDELCLHQRALERHAFVQEGETDRQSSEIARLQQQLRAVRHDAGLPPPTSEQTASVDIPDNLRPSAREVAEIHARMPDLSLALALPTAEHGWHAYLRDVELYIDRHGIDTNRDPIPQLLPPDKAAEICRRFEYDFVPPPWDRWDYGAVTLAVLTGSLLDYFLVATPGAAFKGEPQRGSPLTAWMREQSKRLAPITGSDRVERNTFQRWVAELTTAAQRWAKVPYDLVDPKKGLTPNVHRSSSLGHDPVLGLVFGVKDIMCGTCTFIDTSGGWRVVGPLDQGKETGLLEALVTVIVHGFSDVFTAKGLPPPFLSVLQSVTANSGFTLKKGGAPVSVNNVVRYMYANGYDLRHLATMTISPAVAETIVRAYDAVRTRRDGIDFGESDIRDKLKLSKMLVLTHGLLASSNILKTALYGWNPTAMNIAQFAALAKQMLSLVKLSADRDNLVQHQLATGWESLLAESTGVLYRSSSA